MHLLLREQPTRYMKTWQCDHIKRYMHLGEMSIHFWPECMLHINWKTCLRISPQHNRHMSIHRYWTPTFRQLGKASSKDLCPIIWPDHSVWEFAMMLQLPNPTLTHTNFGQTYKDHPITTHSWFNQPFHILVSDQNLYININHHSSHTPQLRSRNWLFKPLHIVFIHCLTTQDKKYKHWTIG